MYVIYDLLSKQAVEYYLIRIQTWSLPYGVSTTDPRCKLTNANRFELDSFWTVFIIMDCYRGYPIAKLRCWLKRGIGRYSEIIHFKHSLTLYALSSPKNIPTLEVLVSTLIYGIATPIQPQLFKTRPGSAGVKYSKYNNGHALSLNIIDILSDTQGN